MYCILDMTRARIFHSSFWKDNWLTYDTNVSNYTQWFYTSDSWKLISPLCQLKTNWRNRTRPNGHGASVVMRIYIPSHIGNIVTSSQSRSGFPIFPWQSVALQNIVLDQNAESHDIFCCCNEFGIVSRYHFAWCVAGLSHIGSFDSSWAILYITKQSDHKYVQLPIWQLGLFFRFVVVIFHSFGIVFLKQGLISVNY